MSNANTHNVQLLKTANVWMLLTFLTFCLCTWIAYAFEQQLPLYTVTLLHVSQMILAGVFKVSYVVRLVSQKQLGLAVR